MKRQSREDDYEMTDSNKRQATISKTLEEEDQFNPQLIKDQDGKIIIIMNSPN